MVRYTGVCFIFSSILMIQVKHGKLPSVLEQVAKPGSDDIEERGLGREEIVNSDCGVVGLRMAESISYPSIILIIFLRYKMSY